MSDNQKLGISVRLIRNFEFAPKLAVRAGQDYDPTPIRPEMPSFDHIPTEHGREAARRLWRSAFGDPLPEYEPMRVDVLYGIGVLRSDLAVKVQS